MKTLLNKFKHKINRVFAKERFMCPQRSGVNSTFKVPEFDIWNKKDGKHYCSFCGSLNPKEFMELLEDGYAIEPTDKNYKAYIEPGFNKFYYEHLNESQMKEFIKLCNEDQLNIKSPGYFYVKPFFMTATVLQA